ncbi:sodium-independent anion transporter [Paenibacillus sp. J31TS4]|uniref:SulP family inorganic anion transporter n=1 Tax=Paenibacillus sp. J31TS4 TaxID=2807195 RepID=UPI001B242335|nr:SulP family inorganic anion transporter [Paenibacillus sp. J31TS4]GIP39483.1 sodium-independent anion transporter [Paenibacillus sp. J31TS4]
MNGFSRFSGYRAAFIRKDLASGITVGIIAIPLGMAFAIASGVRPEYGIYTTIIAGILISLFGGSRYQIGGPTGAFVPLLFAIVMQYGYEDLLVAGFLSGILLLLMGVLKLGGLIRYIPRPVTVGFTAGIAVLIFTGQLANALGLVHLEKHEKPLANLFEVITHLPDANPASVFLAGLSLALLLALPRYLPRVPTSLAALLVTGAAATLFYGGQVATIGSTYGPIPASLPHLQWPDLTWERTVRLLGPALTIALLGGIESLLSAVVADGMTGTKHNSNRELIGQGVANMVTPLFGGIPATGAIARTATNIRSGAVSPLSGVIHGAVVLLVLLLFAPYASSIPIAGMAPILMVVAWNMSERRTFLSILRTRTSDSLVLLLTFLLTVFADLTTAVAGGLLLALLLFVRRMGGLLSVDKVLPDPATDKVSPRQVSAGRDCPQISMYTIEGPLFFGAAVRFEREMAATHRGSPGILLLRMGKVPFLDLTGEAHLSALVLHFEESGGTVLVSGLRPQPREMLRRTGLDKRIGEDRFFPRTGKAIAFALTRLDPARCAGCRQFAFRECAGLSSGEAAEPLLHRPPAEPVESGRS